MDKLKVLVACEFSGLVRDEFRNLGHEAFSCDFDSTETPSAYHIQGSASTVLNNGWDILIAFPPCTHLASSGARWFDEKDSFSGNQNSDQAYAIRFFMELINAPIPKICVENPIGIMSTKYKKPTQIIQPWMFGHGEVKSTCLWLKNLPDLVPTNIVPGREERIHSLGPSDTRQRERSRTYKGIASAMAHQWSALGRTMKVTINPKYLESRIFVNFTDEIREVIDDWEINGEPYYKLRPTATSPGGATVKISDAEILDIDASLIIPIESMTDEELEQALNDAENERLIVSDRKQAQSQRRKKATKNIVRTDKAFLDQVDDLLDI